MSDVTFIERDIYIHAHTEDPAENATRKTTRKKLFAALGAGALLAGGGWYAYDALVASKHFGAMRVFIACYLAFAVLSLLCGMATSLGMLIAGRVALGLVGGPLMPLSQMLLLRIFPKEKATTAIVIWAMTTLVGPVTGLLHGKRATAHWAVRDELALFEATLVDARVVTGSRAMTGAGVISGLDLAIDPMTAMRGRGMAGSTSPAFQNTIHAPCRFSEVSRF